MPYSAPNGINPIQYQPSDFTQSMPSSARWQTQFQEYMSNTAHQREMYDLQQAGLNPVLTVNGGSGASTPSGAAVQPSAKKVSRGGGRKAADADMTTGALGSILTGITSVAKKALDIVDTKDSDTYRRSLPDESGNQSPSESRSDPGLFVSDGLLWRRLDDGSSRLANASETSDYYNAWIDSSWNSNLWSNSAAGKVLSGLRINARSGSKGLGLSASATPFKERGFTGRFGRYLEAGLLSATNSDYRNELKAMKKIVRNTNDTRWATEAGYYMDSNGKIHSGRQRARADRRGRSWSAADYKIHD